MKLSERLDGYRRRNPGHPPVNPLTGEPNGGDSSWARDPGAASEPDERGASDGSGPTSGPGTPGDPFDFSIPYDAPYEPILDARRSDDAFDRFRTVTDNRVVATIVLVVLLLALVGPQSPLLFAIILVAGFIVIDHFLMARRAVILGGSAWALMIFLGDFLEGRVGSFVVSMGAAFAVLGFVLAVVVCGVYFSGRALYRAGYRSGQAQADRVIARHIQDRLIDHPDDWSALDGDFLEVEGALNCVRDREHQAEEALRDESRRKDDLVTYLAHDLKTPLASVVGYLSLLEEAPDLPEQQRTRFLGVALEKAHRLDALIEEFFDITRFDFHDIVLTRGYADLGLMLAQVADEFYPALAEQNKSVEVYAPQSITLLVDGDKMARVFNNVMKNAIAYSYEGSTIHIRATREEDVVVIQFENQGDPIPAAKLNVIFEKFYRLDAAREEGWVAIRFQNEGDPIPAAKLNVIFEKFYRLDASRATNRGGAGLGLAIAKEIVTAHGGTISCASTPEHTVFTIVLPGA